MLRQTLPLLLVLVPITVRAQTVDAPVLIQSGAQIQLPAPTGANKPRLQVLIAGSNTVLDDERANIQNGVATARLEADPGIYDVRLVTNDKARTPIGSLRRFQIPGFKREAGRWLFNGSAVVYEGLNSPTVFSTLPILRRGAKTKLPLSIPTTGNLKWDLKTFGAEYGLTFSPSSINNEGFVFNRETEKAQFQQRREALNATNPNGALLLHQPFETRSLYQQSFYYRAQLIDALAPLSDGIILDCNIVDDGENISTSSLINSKRPNSLIKIARRNVEESPNFDLPVFARFVGFASDFQILRAFQDGASNIIVPEGTSSPVLDVLSRQSARFSGAVTLEDAGLRVDDFDRSAPYLRRAGRVPLLARLPGEGNSDKKGDDKSAESLFVAFDSSTDVALLEKIARAAKVGATIYCEGALPPALLPRWRDITKTEIAALPTPKKAIVTLAEPWFWGTLNDQNFDVTQNVTITVKPSIAAQTKDVKGMAKETVARPIARFNDDPNAIMLCPVDKGRIIWAPFDVSGTDLATQTAYYAAISGAMQAALVEQTATRGDASNVSVALRAIPADPENPKSSPISLIAFFNSSNEPVDLNAEVRGNGDYVIDLMTNQKIPVKVRDFGTRMALQIPANGFRWIALAKDEQAWNDAGKNGTKAQLR